MNDELEARLAKADGTWGVVVKPLGQAVAFEHNADMQFPAASVNKVPIILYVLHLVDRGGAQLDRTYNVAGAYHRGGSGVLKYLMPGMRLTLKELITLTLTVSDNTAATFLAHTFGPEHVNDYLVSLGFKTTRLGIHGDGTFDYGITTPREMAALFEGVCDARFMSRAISDLLLGIMKQCKNGSGIRRYLPHDGPDGKNLEIANKGGALDDSRNDAAIVFASVPYILVTLSKGLSDTSYRPDNAGLLAIAKLSAAVYDRLS